MRTAGLHGRIYYQNTIIVPMSENADLCFTSRTKTLRSTLTFRFFFCLSRNEAECVVANQ